MTQPTPDWSKHGLLIPQSRPAIPGGPQSVAAVLEPMLKTAPDDPALIGVSGRYSWRQLDIEVNKAASALRSLGIGPFDRVGVCLCNDVDIVIAFLAAMRMGAVWVGVNRPLSLEEKNYILADSGCQLFITTAEIAAGFTDRAQLPELKQVVALENWRKIVAQQSGDGPNATDIDSFAPAAIAYTSGTTGHPKGAVHSQHNLMVYGAAARECRLHDGPLHAGVQLPLTILNLFVIQVLNAFQCGGKCVCIDAASAQDVARWVKAEGVSHLATVPTIYYDLLKSDTTRADLLSVKFAEVGGTNVPVELIAEFRQKFGISLRSSYGMTEAPAAVTRVAAQDELTPGLIGQSLPHLDVTVRDGTGARRPEGQEGEICVGAADSGAMPGIYLPMLGYWNRAQATQDALQQGRYRTGDLGFVDKSGRMYITGRRSEIILRGGSNVYPAEVERVLGAAPGVAVAAVFGIPDERLGEKVVAAVQIAPSARCAENELKDYCLGRLAKYKVPEQIVFVDSMPKNGMQKIMKLELRKLFLG